MTRATVALAGNRTAERGSLLGLLLFVLVAFAWSSIPFFRPGMLNGETFLFHDNSYSLFTVDQLLGGKLLFRDVFYQYGVLTAYLHAGWAALFGNTIMWYWRLAQFLTCIGVVQLWILLRRSLPAAQALAFGVIVLFPYFLIPEGLVGGVGASVYVGLERICLLSIALAWRVPATRSFGFAFLLGAFLGAMQWIKFGGAVAAGGALLVVDLLVVCLASEEKKRWQRWFLLSVVTFLGFVLVEGILVALAFAFLHAPLATEVLWPSWMVQSYESYRFKSVPIWHWFNFNYFVGHQLPMTAAFLAGLGFAAHVLFMRKMRESARLASAGPYLFLGIFFLIALPIYLPHMWVAMPYVWMILLAAASFLTAAPLWLRGVFLFACCPSFFLSIAPLLHPPAKELRAVNLANDTLWLSPEIANRTVRLQEVLAQVRDARGDGEAPAILGFPMGSGLHHFLGYPAATRHAWFMSGFVQAREEPALLSSLERTFAVVVYFTEPPAGPPQPDPTTWEHFSVPLLTQETALAFANHLQAPIEVDPGCWVFPVRSPNER